MGAYTTVQFAFFKTSAGFPQPGQQITFKYISTNVSVSATQFTIDRIVMEFISEIGYIEASSGLVFKYGKIFEELPEENSQLIEQLAEQNVEQHNRAISVYGNAIPPDGLTSGDNNCYWSAGYIKYGKDAKTTGNKSLIYRCTLPSDYISGANINLHIHYRINEVSESVDYNIIVYYFGEGKVLQTTADGGEDGTWTSDDTANAKSTDTYTITGTGLTAGDQLVGILKFEDNDNTNIIILDDLIFDIPVDSRD